MVFTATRIRVPLERCQERCSWSIRRAYSQTCVEKIVQKYVRGIEKSYKVRQGDYVRISPKCLMTHDNTSSVIKKFEEIGAKSVFDKKQIIFALDHDIQNKDDKTLRKYDQIRLFAERHGVDFYPAGRGIGHQILIEEGYAYPGSLVVASDSHSNMYGGIGCLGTPLVRTDAAAIWAIGETWWQIPPVLKVEFLNELRPGITGKDLIITLCSEFCNDEVLNAAIEFHGERGISKLSIDDRLSIANMTTEWGALAGLFPVDNVTISWLEQRMLSSKGKHHTKENLDSLLKDIVTPDTGAVYTKHLTIDLSTVSQAVSGPNSVKIATPVLELENKKIKIDKAYLVSCVNSRLSDLKAAARILKGRKVSEHVQMYVAPASSLVRQEAEISGDWDAILKSGAKALPAGCGPCIGLGTGLLKEGEVGISATNRNYKGRMGSPLATAYLSSPEVVAASAVNGYISSAYSLGDCAHRETPKVITTIKKMPVSHKYEIQGSRDMVSGFTGDISGQLIFLDADNLNTDGIYPGKYTYRDDITAEHMAKVVMENYDNTFASSIQKGDIIISGYNFGTGSSREQAAVALLHAGIRLVVTGTFSDIYKRNAINNALLVIEVPQLVDDLRANIRSGIIETRGNKQTIRTGWRANVSLSNGCMSVFTNNKVQTPVEYRFSPIGKIAQELVVCGGLVPWAKRRLSELDKKEI